MYGPRLEQRPYIHFIKEVRMKSLCSAYHGLNRFENILHKKVLQPITFVVFSIACISCLFQVIYRFILVKITPFTFPYTDEITRYSIILSVWLILALAMKEGLHPSVDIIKNKLNMKGKYILYFIIKAIVIICLIFMIINLFGIIQTNKFFKSPMMQIRGPILYSIPLFGVFMLSLQTFVELLGVVSKQVVPFEKPLLSESETQQP